MNINLSKPTTKLKNRQKYGGTVVHCERDALGLIEVVDTQHMRGLFFGPGAEQSRLYFNAPMTLALEYQEVIEQLVLNFCDRYPVSRMLMLGLGGGTLVTHLNRLLPNVKMDVVELRQAVIDLAYRYFYLPDVAEVTPICGDAREFMAQANACDSVRCDVLIIDLFDDQGLPDAFAQFEFQQHCLNHINTPGLVIFNLWNSLDPQIKAQTEQLINAWQRLQAEYLNAHPRARFTVERYQIHSSENIILCIQR